jgi:pectate lyase
MMNKIQFFLLLFFVAFIPNIFPQSYSYQIESFEDGVWTIATNSQNPVNSSTGKWTTAKNNISVEGTTLATPINPVNGSKILYLATKTNALTSPELGNGVGVITYNVIKTGSRTITVSSSKDNITWTPLESFIALSSWTKRTIILNDQTVRYIKFEVNSNGGIYLDDILITSDGSANINVSTTAAVDITEKSVVVGGDITSSSGDIITGRGVCYTSSTVYLDTVSSKVLASGTTGAFSVNINNLPPNTTYRYKAFAVSSKGVNYGPELTFTTRPIDVPTYWKQSFNDASIMPTSTTAIPAIAFNVPDQGEWIYYGTFRGSNVSYIVDGSGSCLRMPKNGTYVITPLLNSGVTTLTFDEGRGSKNLTVYTSTDGGINWSSPVSIFTVRGLNTISLNDGTINRIKIANESSNGDADIDNIIITAVPSGVQASVTTINGTNITKNTATAGGEVTDAGSKPPVTERGVCWSTTTYPFTADNKVASGSGLGAFSGELTGLPAGTVIHLRAYAKTTAGTAYGNELTFTTLPATLPELTTITASDIKGETAISGGNVSYNGGAPVSAQGVCWNTTGNPSIADNKSSDSTNVSNYQSLMKNLVPNTTYFYRAYATNVAGTGYGEVASFTTLSVQLPAVTTSPVSSLRYFKAKGNGIVTGDGGAWTTRGICWNTTGNPTISDNKVLCGVNLGAFSGNMENLAEATKYYVRAYASNSVGIVYGNEISFTTPVNPWLTEPIGFAEGTTGGGMPTPENSITVTNAAELETALKNPAKSVVYVFGTINLPNKMISVVLKNKSLIGLPGATIYNPGRLLPDETGNIGLGAGSHNVIIRNILFKGAGAYDCDGNDLLTNNGCTKLWVDHCEFQDGVDDSFDNTNSADSITISWCKFSNLIAAKSGGSGGSADHRFANLVGGSDESFPADGHYSITFQNIFYGSGIKDRMARARNAELHFLNCYWNSQAASNNISLTGGVNGCSVYVESSVYNCTGDGVNLSGPQRQNVLLYDNTYGGVPYTSPAVNDATDVGVATAPTYDYKPMNRTEVVAAVSSTACGAGATLLVEDNGIISVNCTPSPVLISSPNRTQDVYVGNAITPITFIWSGTATGATVTGLPAGLTSALSLTNKSLTITGIPTESGSFTVNTSGGTGIASKQGTITVTQIPPPTVSTPANKSQTVLIGTPIENIIYTWGGGATGLTVTGLPNGISSAINAENKTLTLSGIPTTMSTYTVTTVGGTGGALNVQGLIKLKAQNVVPKVAYITNPASINYMNDNKIIPALLADVNMDVTEVSSATAKGAAYYNAFDLVILSEVAGSTDAGIAELKGLNKPFVMMKVHSYKSEAGAWNWASSGYGQNLLETNITVSNKNHPIFKDVNWVNTNEVQLLSKVDGGKGITYMNPSSFNSVSGGAVTSLANVKGALSEVSIFEIPAGVNISGTLIQQKFMQIGINSSSYANITSDGVSIVKNACYYLLNIVTGISNSTYNENVKVYPSQARNTVNVQAESTINSIKVITLDGRMVVSENPEEEFVQIDVSHIQNGIYAIIIKTNHSTIVQKIQVIK